MNSNFFYSLFARVRSTSISIVMLFAFSALAVESYAQYCTPLYTTGCASQDDINTITLNGANGTSINQLNTGCSAGGYIYYSTIPTIQFNSSPTMVNTYAGTINSNFSGSEYMRTWIDFNDNFTFEPSELVSTAGPFGTALVPFTVSIPQGANGGIHRMRVRVVWANTTAFDPCLSYTWGEAHDYNVQVIAGPPPPTVTNNGPVCLGAQVTITATSPLTNIISYTLVSGPGVTTPISNTTGIFTVTATATGAYGVTVDTGGLSPSGAGLTTVTITNAPTITQGAITNPTTCNGTNGSIVIGGLSNNASFSYYYSKNGVPVGPVTTTTSSTGTITIGGLSAGVYSLIRVTGSSVCTSNVLPTVFLSDPGAPAAPTVTYNAPLCLGSTLILTASSPSSGAYTWSGPNAFAPTATGASVQRTGLTFLDTGLYFVNIKNASNCTSAPGSVRVTIVPPPAAPVTTPISFCQGSPATPLTANGQNLKWYLAATGGTALASAPVPNTTTPGTQTFYVSQTVTCESPRAPVIVTIVPKPPVPDADTVVEVCQFAAPTPLTATGSGLRWYTTATGGTGSATPSSPATTATGIYFFYVSQTVAGCESDRQQIRVIVKPKPAPPVVLSPVRLCQNDEAAPLNAQGQNLLWYTTPGGIGGIPTAPIPFTGYEDTLMYYVSQTVNGCESDRSLINVAVNFKPNVSIQASRDYACVGDTISFNYYGNGRVTSNYIWSITGPGTIVSGQGTQGPLALRYTQPGFYTVSLVVDNNGCISRTETRTFEIRGIPRFAINAPEAGCQGQPITISAIDATQGIDSFAWDFDGGTAVAGSFAGGPYSVVFPTQGIKNVSVVVSTRECGAQRVSDAIRIEAAPNVNIAVVDNGTVCAGDTIRLVAEYYPTFTYKWSPDAFFDGARTSTVDARIGKSGFVKLETLSSLGCRDIDSIYVTVKNCCDAKLPTAFSPNGDGRNDYFRIITQGFNDLSTFRVTNRWGRTVWETGDNMSNGWDGTISNTPAENGVYFWFLRYTCTDGLIYEKSGEVTLIR